jgi:hypothetical protein
MIAIDAAVAVIMNQNLMDSAATTNRPDAVQAVAAIFGADRTIRGHQASRSRR